ncbi:MAG TPA: ATP-binding protein [Longimicrobium sp.]|uniref:sensor histidine kinase n=1 Tax=Longimicrobium sp. TaxID=2029185 RepID=UPI002EDAC7CD
MRGAHVPTPTLAPFSARRRWAAAVVLGVAGLLLNLLPLPLSPGTDLIFGGVAYLLAAVALGPWHGLVAAGIASVRTLWLWNHPYAVLIFCMEALFVGYLARRERRPLVGDLVYWIVGGVPLLFLTYWTILGVRGSTAAVLFLKQPFNGLIDALVVEALLLVPAVRGALGIHGRPPLRAALAVVVTVAATLPALAFGTWTGLREWDLNVARARERLRLSASGYASRLGEYVQLHTQEVRTLAETAERRGSATPAEMQALVESGTEFPGFLTIYAADARGRSIAAHPLVDPTGRKRVGADYSHRDYYRRVLETRRTVVSEVLHGATSREPVIVIAHPVVLGDTMAAFVAGAVNLRRLPVPDPPPGREERLHVADLRGRVIYDSDAPYHQGDVPHNMADSAGYRAVLTAPDGGVVTFSRGGPRAPAAQQAARVLAAVERIPSLGWVVWIEQPYSSIQGFVADSYVRLLSLLIGVIVLALGASSLLAAYLAEPLLHMRATAMALAGGDRKARVGRLVAGAPAEVAQLGRDFDDMAAALARRAEELEELGEIARSLASTHDTGEVLRRVTEAVVRLVECQGCGIALLLPDGMLRISDDATGLLRDAAGRELPAETTLVGCAAREGRPLLVRDIATDPRATGTVLDVRKVESAICAPLLGRSGALGALTAVRARGAEPFSDADLMLLDRLSRHAAVAVENAQLLEAAQAAARARSDFIATMSHELRTPLNAVLGHVELLQMGIHGPVTPPQVNSLARIQTASRHLRGLIEEVLSFSRLEAGHAEVRTEPVDLCDLAREVADVIQPLAMQKALEFRLDGCDPHPVVQTDPDKVRQILINLAGNAVKFTDEGEVSIQVRSMDGVVALSVCDTGPGIPHADQERLFRPFEQLESGLARTHGGTGLGLYLSGQYARMLGGTIEVKSEPGQGSTFSLVLPREFVADDPAEHAKAEGEDR